MPKRGGRIHRHVFRIRKTVGEDAHHFIRHFLQEFLPVLRLREGSGLVLDSINEGVLHAVRNAPAVNVESAEALGRWRCLISLIRGFF